MPPHQNDRSRSLRQWLATVRAQDAGNRDSLRYLRCHHGNTALRSPHGMQWEKALERMAQKQARLDMTMLNQFADMMSLLQQAGVEH